MTKIALKIICSLSALFGAYILFFLWFAINQGFFESLSTGTATLKVGSTLIRAVFLLLCVWAAWQRPKLTIWFAWGAFFAFAVGGAANEIFRFGFIGGFGNLIPTYYTVVSVHALFAVTVWLLVKMLPSGVKGD